MPHISPAPAHRTPQPQPASPRFFAMRQPQAESTALTATNTTSTKGVQVIELDAMPVWNGPGLCVLELLPPVVVPSVRCIRLQPLIRDI
jgi:hypothetical protein